MAKRGRKPSEKRKGYFYENEEQAVIDYVTADDQEIKNQIFMNNLKPAFTKMIESIIRRYNLYLPDEEFEDTFNDTLSFLLSKIEHFKPESGFKAYSYCGTICKNYLILKVKQYNNNLIRNDRYENVQCDIDDNVKFSYSQEDSYVQTLTELVEKTSNGIENIINRKDEYKLSTNEIKVGYALVNLLTNWDELFARMGSNKFNKSSILMFLKETTLLSTPEIRSSMKKYKAVYQEIRKNIF